MAEQEAAAEAPEQKKKPPLKLILIVSAIMVVEAVAVFGFLAFTGSCTARSSAMELEGLEEAGREAAVELLLIEEKFQNMSTNRVWVWDAAIYLKVREKNRPAVQKIMETRKAEIAAGVSLIFRKAQHNQLREPGQETLTRQLTAYVNEVFGTQQDGTPRVERVLIPKCKGFPAD
ncbi:MAG: hypothetical protein KIS87_01555 [Phycisphaeraceae bacterium]|nr:hypothetical protein [Phycisphaeraceae bacterium]